MSDDWIRLDRRGTPFRGAEVLCSGQRYDVEVDVAVSVEGARRSGLVRRHVLVWSGSLPWDTEDGDVFQSKRFQRCKLHDTP